MVALIRPDSPRLWDIARALVEEYAATLGVPLDFQDFAHERRHLPSEYGPPHGMFLLAHQDDAFVGCGAFRRLSDSACEMKRLYVGPSSQTRGIGRMIATALIAEARRIGYREMLLDTLPAMHAAQALYASLGFTPVPPYRLNPVPGAKFLKLDLRNAPQHPNMH
jgi:GNAT superfamily N-acetyltransferase